MDNEICTISIGKGVLDDDYTFYEDGRIFHFYDQSAFKLNQEKWITADEIADHTKTKILDKCNEEFKGRIKDILSSLSL